MLKNKKARGEMIGAIGRIVLAGLGLFIVVKIIFGIFGPAFSDQVDYSESFEELVKEINSLEPKDAFLGLNIKSAVIGFSSGPNSYECNNCYFDSIRTCTPGTNICSTTHSMHSIRVDRPTSAECDNACVCLCDNGFVLELEDTVSSNTGFPSFIPITNYIEIGQCQREIECRALNEELDIVHRTIINENDDEEWNNGFLFLRGVEGISIPDKEMLLLFVQRESNIIGVCDEDMIDYNKNILGVDGCINGN